MRCTYCGGGKFYEGPSGGLSTNVLCANPDCRHWFNHTPFGLDDLKRIEPTKQEKEHQAAEALRRYEEQRRLRMAEGRAAYMQGQAADTLRKDPAYAGTAERENNIDRLTGYLQAMAEDIRGLRQSRKPEGP